MAQDDCARSIQFCRLRIARLNQTTGAPIPGATNSYVSDNMALWTATPVYEAGEEFREKNGCGSIQNPYKEPNRLIRYDVGLSIMSPDPEQVEIITGAGLITEGGDSIGWTSPGSDSQPPLISVEGWTKATVAGVQDAARPWWKFAWPGVRLEEGERRYENGQLVLPFSGFAVINLGWENGPFNDWPSAAAPVSLNTFYGKVRTAAIPAAACGYTVVPAAA